jgi:dihydropteroate synthase
MLKYFQCGRYRFDLRGDKTRPLVMGILNITPDSFSDGGQYVSLDAALDHAERMIADGVDIIDIGGESTRPGSQPVPLQQELDRVMPVIYALRDCGKALSIDTNKPDVMKEALAAGVDMINDIGAFAAEGAVDVVMGGQCGLCVMHMQGNPQSMQNAPQYVSVVEEVTAFLQERVVILEAAGVARDRICVDPGFGFGKTVEHNLTLLRNLENIETALDLPLLAGLSRKSVVAAITGRPVDRRLAGNLAAALIAVYHGARILRVHEVAETMDALRIWEATMNGEKDGA